MLLWDFHTSQYLLPSPDHSSVQFSSLQSLSHVWLFATPWTAARQASKSIINCQSLPKLMSTESVMPSNYLILCRPLLLLPSISHPYPCPGPSESFPWISSSYQVDKVLEFQFQHQSFQWISGLISFRIDWFDLLAVQETLKSLLQILQFKSINSLALSFLYSPTLTSIHDYWKNHSLD